MVKDGWFLKRKWKNEKGWKMLKTTVLVWTAGMLLLADPGQVLADEAENVIWAEMLTCADENKEGNAGTAVDGEAASLQKWELEDGLFMGFVDRHMTVKELEEKTELSNSSDAKLLSLCFEDDQVTITGIVGFLAKENGDVAKRDADYEYYRVIEQTFPLADDVKYIGHSDVATELSKEYFQQYNDPSINIGGKLVFFIEDQEIVEMGIYS